jgi:3-isopropylmalate dehydrogenase|tara:strand:+ start:37 stop:1140 length:1104 start_codon:yes stop_codon:yes gene_type:complete
MTNKILILPGDGIGHEVMKEVSKVITWFNDNRSLNAEIEFDNVGGTSYDIHGSAISEDAMKLAKDSDAVLFGAVGGPKWDNVEYENRPEAGLLRLRKDLDLFANLRPAICFPALVEASALKREIIEGLDIVIVRELTGGIYFGEPRGIEDLGSGNRRGINTQVYETWEIRRIAEVAFELAKKRNNKVTSSEKRNVMESGLLWNEEVTKIHQEKYSDVELDHMLADNCGMQLVRWPKQFDVIVTDNLFGDMLSDVAAMLTGSLGMLPSASLGKSNNGAFLNALYEPVHGSAPDIEGQGVANPLASILSFAMALRYSFSKEVDADILEKAISNVLDSGLRTKDISTKDSKIISTVEMGDAVVTSLNGLN